MIEEFVDKGELKAHEAFQHWRREHMDGYFLNVKSPAVLMLHRTNCVHHGDVDWNFDEPAGWGSLTRTRKVCAAHLQDLLDWAQATVPSAVVQRCKDCRPE